MPQLPDTPLYEAALRTAARLGDAGKTCFMVGGAVRDMALGKPFSDIDLVTDATPEEVLHVFPDAETVGAAFGVMLVKNEGGVFEVATAREERNYLDGRHPESVKYTTDFRIDAARRDFTVNAMLYDFSENRIIDFFGGLSDLKQGIIRTVGDPEARFGEDYLRMLRCVRFAARLGFSIDEAAFEAMRQLAPKCALLAAERIRGELELMLTGRDPSRAMTLLFDCGILDAVLPEVARLKGVTQHPVYHPEGDVWQHTMLMLDHMVYPDALLAWSVLFHDLGKFTCRSEDADGIHFYCHESAGEEIARAVMTRLKFSSAAVETVAFAVADHMRFASVAQMRQSKLRRMIGHPDFAMHLELNRLDCISCHGMMEAFCRLLDEVSAMNGEVKLPEPMIMGRDLIAAGLKPSPRFKELLDELFERQLSGEFSRREEALAAARDLIKKL